MAIRRIPRLRNLVFSPPAILGVGMHGFPKLRTESVSYQNCLIFWKFRYISDWPSCQHITGMRIILILPKFLQISVSFQEVLTRMLPFSSFPKDFLQHFDPTILMPDIKFDMANIFFYRNSFC